jgi:Protein of unknown function (DUF3048) N-terminal domain/Protein of unknown function (DUF3048) C-terminal domain
MRGRRIWSLAAILVALLVMGACSEDAPTPAEQAAETESKSPRVPEPDICPLTGEDPGDVDTGRPAVAVKIENSPQARPQSGLESADLVFEERVEGGITRFLVIYHCGTSKKAGPVRSGRFDDPKIAKPFTRMLVASGSNSIVQREMEKQGMLYFEENTIDGLFRDPPGVIDVHSLYANVDALRKVAAKNKVKPPRTDVFEFGDPVDADKARRVTINFVDSNAIEYRWKGGMWKRYEAGVSFTAASGKQIAVPNLLVQQVRVDDSDTVFDVAGNPSPDIELEKSEGKLLLFRDGLVVKGRWKMGKVGDPIQYLDSDGEPLRFAEGPIWVELVPNKKGEVKGKVSFK